MKQPFFSRCRRLLFSRSFCLLALGMLIAADAFARAGGGGGYGGGSSGGGGGFSGGGGGGGDGMLFYLLIQLIVRYPAVGIPLLIIVTAFLILAKRQGYSAYQGHTIHQAKQFRGFMKHDNVLGNLQAVDPAFQTRIFMNRVHSGFLKIQNGWCQQDLTAARIFLSDGVYERFQLQLQEQKDLGYHDQMEEITISNLWLEDFSTGGGFQSVTVGITANAIDYRVSLSDGEYLSGSRQPEYFTEYWTFLRRQGAVTKSAGNPQGLLEGHCPNCGAALNDTSGDAQHQGQHADCPYCGALLRSGEHDWVLCEITQAMEWEGSSQEDATGADTIRKSDPDFSVQQLEDKVSVMFWRQRMSYRAGNTKLLRSFVTEPCLAYETESLKKMVRPDGNRWYYGECAVGGIRTLGFLTEKDVDRALVEVSWAGREFRVQDGVHKRWQGNAIQARYIFILERTHGASSESAKGFSSAHCPHCGAPEESDANGMCVYCGEPLKDEKRDWLLAQALPWSDERTTHLVSLLRASEKHEQDFGIGKGLPAAQGMLSWATAMVLADGEVTVEETQQLQKLALKFGLPPESVETLIDASRCGNLQPPQPENNEQARKWLTTMADIALADGKIQREEARLLQQMGNRLGLQDYDLKLLLQKRKAELYRTAREELREAKLKKTSFEDWKQQIRKNRTGR